MTSRPDYYRFVACPKAECRLRFPGVEGVLCPLCKTPTLLACDRAPMPELAPPQPKQELALLLDNVRSVFNVGSIFRSADGCGIETIYLAGITPTPAHPSMRKTALGAEETITWSQHNNSLDLADQLIEEGKQMWALECTETSVPISEATLGARNKAPVLILGNEVTGVDPGLLERCEQIIHIPMRGHKASLNVATAAGIAAYCLCQPKLC